MEPFLPEGDRGHANLSSLQKKTEELPQTLELGPKRSLPSRSLVSKLQTSDFSTQMHQIFTRALHAAL